LSEKQHECIQIVLQQQALPLESNNAGILFLATLFWHNQRPTLRVEDVSDALSFDVRQLPKG
ncbi:MAG: hypothetical protein O7C75_15245, partial [Verrucomicrobia bacterium]|nr:hypothetical protein [Verrucomicrobiota bacterium]